MYEALTYALSRDTERESRSGRGYFLTSTKVQILTQKALLGEGGGGHEGERESGAPPRAGAVRRRARGGAGIWFESVLTYADLRVCIR